MIYENVLGTYLLHCTERLHPIRKSVPKTVVEIIMNVDGDYKDPTRFENGWIQRKDLKTRLESLIIIIIECIFFMT